MPVEPMTVTLRVRMSTADAHYGGDLVAGARILQLFGDVLTEIAVRTDGDEGLLAEYSEVKFTAPVHPGDFIEVAGRLVHSSRLRRVVSLEARKVVESRYEEGRSRGRVLQEPTRVCVAVAVVVVPMATGRRRPA